MYTLIRPLPANQSIIPAPARLTPAEGTLKLRSLGKIEAPAECRDLATSIRRMAAFFSIPLSGQDDAAIRLNLDRSMPHEAWQMTVSAQGIALCGDEAGLFYAYTALSQMFCAAASCGAETAELDCCHIEDQPRFGWRGFMLDPARHFQPVEVVKQVIRIMAHYRLNVLHWHLTDSQGFRIMADGMPDLHDLAEMDEGSYSTAEIREIVAYARKHFITIVPEMDFPGHSHGLLMKFPHFACNPQEPWHEYCLANREAMAFIKGMLEALMKLFPDSKIIHIGGDEANTHWWDRCPACQKAMKDKGFANIRQLENAFMLELCQFLLAHGRTPLVWSTESSFPKNVMIQAWNEDNVQKILADHNGNRIVYATHTYTYFDYRTSPMDPSWSWMRDLPVEEVASTDPYRVWDDQPKDLMAGVEGCLWTEIAPSWRILPKILPRIGALAESGWSLPENRSLMELLKRRDYLYFAGYEEFLRAEL